VTGAELQVSQVNSTLTLIAVLILSWVLLSRHFNHFRLFELQWNESWYWKL